MELVTNSRNQCFHFIEFTISLLIRVMGYVTNSHFEEAHFCSIFAPRMF